MSLTSSRLHATVTAPLMVTPNRLRGSTDVAVSLQTPSSLHRVRPANYPTQPCPVLRHRLASVAADVGHRFVGCTVVAFLLDFAIGENHKVCCTHVSKLPWTHAVRMCVPGMHRSAWSLGSSGAKWAGITTCTALATAYTAACARLTYCILGLYKVDRAERRAHAVAVLSAAHIL